MTQQLQMPFKPFTIDEVQAICGIDAKVLDSWVGDDVMSGKQLPLHLGDDGLTRGLDWMQTFAVFVGAKYLHENAPPGRAWETMRYVASLSLEQLEAEIRAGRTFPVVGGSLAEALRQTGQAAFPRTARVLGMMVEAPQTPLGHRLRLDRLLTEYKHALTRVFPTYAVHAAGQG